MLTEHPRQVWIGRNSREQLKEQYFFLNDKIQEITSKNKKTMEFDELD